jgi:hypothetical protein
MNFGPKYEPQKGDIAVNKMLENTKQHGKSELLNAYRF